MTHSLLCSAGVTPSPPRADDALLAALSLDRALTVILPDVHDRRAIAPYLTAPDPDPADIAHRQAVMRDFLDRPTTLERWQSVFARLTELKKQADDERRITVGALARSGEETLLHLAKSRLQTAAMTLRRLLLLLIEADAQLGALPLTAPALRSLAGRIHAIATAPETAALLARCLPLCTLSAGATCAFALTLDEAGRVADCRYLDRAIPDAPPQPTKKRLFGGRKPEPQTAHHAVLDSAAKSLDRRLAADGLDGGAQALETISSALFAELCPIARELDFFAAGLRFAQFFAARGLPVTLPALADDGRQSGVGLYDPFLGATIPNGSALVPADLDLAGDCPGLMVTGANNAGKTVLLRALGCAILLGQAGFPVCAERATITPVREVRCLFAAGEAREQLGSEAGRFEAEVAALADLVARAGRGELILLNEPFQTTAYAEGAEALGEVLRYLTGRRSRWVLVTHLAVSLDESCGAKRLSVLPDHTLKEA